MTAQGEDRVVGTHPAAVVADGNQAGAATGDLDRDAAGSRVQ